MMTRIFDDFLIDPLFLFIFLKTRLLNLASCLNCLFRILYELLFLTVILLLLAQIFGLVSMRARIRRKLCFFRHTSIACSMLCRSTTNLILCDYSIAF
jgi:hypothetical protein